MLRSRSTKDRSVAVTPAPCPIINGEDARRGRRLAVIAGRTGHSQQRIGADRHGQPFGQVPAGLAAERMGKVTLQAAQPLRPACGCRCNPGQAFGEGLADAAGVQAAEPPSLDLQRHWTALPGQVGKGALIAAMKPLGHLAAGRANGRRLMRAGGDDDVIGGGHDPHDGEAGRDQGQHARGQGRPSTWGASLRAHPNSQRQHGKCGRTQNSIAEPSALIYTVRVHDRSTGAGRLGECGP